MKIRKYRASARTVECSPSTHKQFVNMSGQRFGRWLVIRFYGKRIYESGNEVSLYLCQCDCGNERLVLASNMRSGISESCGCLKEELTSKRATTHGMSKTPIWFVWMNMHERCRNPNNTEWENYGGRGIRVCEEWKSFEGFFEDMKMPPTPKHTIERVDVNGNYEKSNCVWATHIEQGRNRRNNRVVTYDGQTRCLTEWAELLGINDGVISRRLNRGWSVERALTEPSKPRGYSVILLRKSNNLSV